MKKSDTYLTVSGDTWDLISFKIYGTEKFMIDLMRANPEHLGTIIFESGILIKCPDVDYSYMNLPPWKRGE